MARRQQIRLVGEEGVHFLGDPGRQCLGCLFVFLGDEGGDTWLSGRKVPLPADACWHTLRYLVSHKPHASHLVLVICWTKPHSHAARLDSEPMRVGKKTRTERVMRPRSTCLFCNSREHTTRTSDSSPTMWLLAHTLAQTPLISNNVVPLHRIANIIAPLPRTVEVLR